jgi:hypothetical protein
MKACISITQALWGGCFFLLFSLFLTSCSGCEGPDEILFSNGSGEPIGILLDGREANGTFTDRVIITPDTAGIELAADVIDDPLQGEIAAFTRNRLPSVNFPVTFQEGKDVERVDFQNEVFIDFTVWIVETDLLHPVGTRMTTTLEALLYADNYWQLERMGLRLGSVRFVDLTSASGYIPRDIDHGGPADLTSMDLLATRAGEEEDRINIYLIRKVNNSRNLAAAQQDGNRVALGMYAGGADQLFHLLMQSFSLGEISAGTPGFTSRNVCSIANNPFTNRRYISEGQLFRAHVNPASALNDTYEIRPGEYQFDCPDATTSPRCPSLDTRIFVDDFGIAN